MADYRDREPMQDGQNSLNNKSLPYFTCSLEKYFEDEIEQEKYLDNNIEFFLDMALDLEKNYNRKRFWLLYTFVFKLFDIIDRNYDTDKDEKFTELNKSASYLEKIRNTQFGTPKCKRTLETKKDRILSNIITILKTMVEHKTILKLK